MDTADVAHLFPTRCLLMLISSQWLKLFFYNIVFYKYIFINIKWNFSCRDILISILMMSKDGKNGLGTAIAKA
ncbi:MULTISPECIES: hypothetical protein [Acinetobacter]|uniref:hypothetical protein n=2 Tax=Acinetobacter TaxID=469 RepID=UPI0005555D58|nr:MULTISPECIES: hypothetical protein [Acinetobacter]MCG6039209.1 hypothetical protein [Acinetobacter baumannii]MCU4637353.1 hypothetical protein [Acinetobacter sp. WU_MDCI_Abxa265]RFF23004.1 hypothetical protein DZ985_16925 [Acinetobacter sp. JW]